MKKTNYGYPHPLLNCIFFDEAKSEIPERYILLTAEQTLAFNDSIILGGTLDIYYHILNIYAFRLIHNPNSKIKIIGCNDNDSKSEKGNIELSKKRALSVYNYFKNVWKLDDNSLDVSWVNLSQHPSKTNFESFGMQENRRVEIICEDWNIVRPVIESGTYTEPQPPKADFVMKNGMDDDLVLKRRIEIKRGKDNWNTLTVIGISEQKSMWNWKNSKSKFPINDIPFIAQLIITTKSGEEYKSDPIIIPVIQTVVYKRKLHYEENGRGDYIYILFPFESVDLDSINKRILSEYICMKIFPNTVIQVVGHNDIDNNNQFNMELSKKRTKTIRDFIKEKTYGKYESLNYNVVGKEDILYSNEFPEGRFYNRIIEIFIKTLIYTITSSKFVILAKS